MSCLLFNVIKIKEQRRKLAFVKTTESSLQFFLLLGGTGHHTQSPVCAGQVSTAEPLLEHFLYFGTEVHYVAQAGLDLVTLLPLPSR